MTDNINITNIDNTPIAGVGAKFQNDTLTITVPGVDPVTVKAGTILARDSVTLKLVPYVKGGATNENGIPKAVLVNDATAAATGDVSVRPLIGGEARLAKLVIDADGDGSNIDAAVVDQLRDYGLIALETSQLAAYDNPQ